MMSGIAGEVWAKVESNDRLGVELRGRRSRRALVIWKSKTLGGR